MSLLQYSLMLGQKDTALKNKLDSAIARLDRVCLQDDNDNDDGLLDEKWYKQRVKLFEWVLGINYNL